MKGGCNIRQWYIRSNCRVRKYIADARFKLSPLFLRPSKLAFVNQVSLPPSLPPKATCKGMSRASALVTKCG
jgi:hypothetical protein